MYFERSGHIHGHASAVNLNTGGEVELICIIFIEQFESTITSERQVSDLDTNNA